MHANERRPDERPALLELEIRRYKNLANVRVDWAGGLALFGANGSGKSNILEALAWLIGDAQTLALAAPRLDGWDPGDLAMIVRVDPEELPLAPADVVDNPWTGIADGPLGDRFAQ